MPGIERGVVVRLRESAERLGAELEYVVRHPGTSELQEYEVRLV